MFFSIMNEITTMMFPIVVDRLTNPAIAANSAMSHGSCGGGGVVHSVVVLLALV